MPQCTFVRLQSIYGFTTVVILRRDFTTANTASGMALQDRQLMLTAENAEVTNAHTVLDGIYTWSWSWSSTSHIPGA